MELIKKMFWQSSFKTFKFLKEKEVVLFLLVDSRFGVSTTRRWQNFLWCTSFQAWTILLNSI